MRKLHQLFEEPGASLIRKSATGSPYNICWYPSAGDDFRHIIFLENEWFGNSDKKLPFVYLHTDVCLPNQGNIPNGSGELPFELRHEVAPGLTVEEVCEVSFKVPPSEKSPDVLYDVSHNSNIGRCFFVLVRVEKIHRGKLLSWQVPLIYSIAENLSFLVRILLKYQLKVQTLIHIRDGGASMGGSRIPMNFIYLVSDSLRIQRVISDLSPASRFSFMDEGVRALEHEIRRAEHDEHFRMMASPSGRRRTNLFGDLMGTLRRRHYGSDQKNELALSWKSQEISTRDFPANWAVPSDGHYYDWRKVQFTGSIASS